MPPNMTLEQAAELKALRKQEAASVKAVDQLERDLQKQINKIAADRHRHCLRLRRACDQAERLEVRTEAKLIKPLRTQLNKLTQGRVPEASALAAIRHRIAILEQRLTS